jgi:hypothetical protein
MKLTLADALPSLSLLGAIVLANVSGNDKAPFIVLAVLSGILFYGWISGFLGFFKLLPHWVAVRRAASALVPLLYAGCTLALSRTGWVDSGIFLGVR